MARDDIGRIVAATDCSGFREREPRSHDFGVGSKMNCYYVPHGYIDGSDGERT